MAQYNLISLYQQAFGQVRFPGPPIDSIGQVNPLASNNDIEVPAEDQADYTSMLGTPIFFPLTIDGYKLPNEPLITLRRPKTIVKTTLQGIDSSVKEEINDNDWTINIKGIIINEENDNYPADEVRKVRTLCDKKGSLKVESPILSIFGIDQIVISNRSFNGIAGHQNVQTYQINALSDRPIELIIKEGV